jgi:hypothetical protein
MLKEKLVERIHIRMGELNQSGDRQDTITSKWYGKSIVSNAATQALDWRWRVLESIGEVKS